ncbi:hypothetical protein DFH11DRAFT_1290089 [Phellopilus nigrolimitatus]|nr:hypothetical protein DFH11DRAFT_1290089 [Phellopilus nigrolimitatus]
MKNLLNDVSSDSQPPLPKRIKLETDDAQLLSGPIKKGHKSNKASELEKRALGLLQDPRISAVEPQQVMCRMCGHWVKLFKHTDFSPANWNTHAEKCEMRSG